MPQAFFSQIKSGTQNTKKTTIETIEDTNADKKNLNLMPQEYLTFSSSLSKSATHINKESFWGWRLPLGLSVLYQFLSP